MKRLQRENAPERTRLIPFTLIALLLVATAACNDASGFTKEELIQFQKAQDLYRSRKFDDAQEVLKGLIAQKPGNIEAGVLRAKILFFTRDYAASESVLRSYLKNDEDNPYVLMWLGKTIAVQEERNAEAIEIFRTIVERDPENYLARYYLGRCLERDQKLKPALEQYYNALALEYELTKIHRHLGKLLTEMKMDSRAAHHQSRVQMLERRPGAAPRGGERKTQKPVSQAKEGRGS